ncbi:MAG: cobalamin-independent methionine synthase II family protein [Candidatus Limnocylindrales bacterium]
MAEPYQPTPLTTSVVGSHAHPGWLDLAVAAAERGELGPRDIAELGDDAVDIALRDQEDAGIDVVVEGEMRRVGFFTAEFYRHLTGVRALEPARRLGPAGHDQQHRFEVLEPIAAPEGLGVVAEFEYARTRTDRPIKVTVPGPFTLSGRLTYGEGQVYPDRIAAARAFVPILAAELEGLVGAGATYIQIDEPSPAIHPEASDEFAALFNDAAAGVQGRVALAAHLCFGNFFGRPLSRRLYRPVLEQALAFEVSEFVLEFANREMAELDVAADITAAGRHLSAGVIDVKNYYLETADDVAWRLDRLLEAGVPEARLSVVPDCGFSQTARWAVKPKLAAMVAGRDLVRGQTA